MNDTPVRQCRSQLATPANSLPLVEKAVESEVDEVLLDLEDSLHANEKVEARANISTAVQEHDWDGKPLKYRINGIQTRWWYEDVIEIIGDVGRDIDGIIVPKVRTPADIQTVENLLCQVEVNAGLPPGEITLAAQIEDATGIGNVEAIAGASDRLEALIFGPGDYSTSIEAKGQIIGINSEYPGHYWHYPLSRISHAAASENLLAIDGLYSDVDDIEGFREFCKYARMLGYDGKWVIHPDQIEAANKAFAPSRGEAERARQVVSSYEESGPDEIPTVDGKVVDEEMVGMARRVLKKAQLAGVLDEDR